MRKSKQIMAAFLLAAISSATAGAQNVATASAAGSATPAVGGALQAATSDPNYVIGAQDMIDISVWKEPEVSRQVPVRPDGKISLPLLNDVQAAGLTPTQLAEQITAKLGKFINTPQVAVIVVEINSQRVYLLGEIAKAGAYVLLPDMTVLQALSNAGGFTPFSNLKNIYVLRVENGKQQKFFFNYKEVIAGRRSEQNIVLKPGDTIVVP